MLSLPTLPIFVVLLCLLPSGCVGQMEEFSKIFEQLGFGVFNGQLFFCPNNNQSVYKEEFELHYYGKPTAFITTKSVGKNIRDIVDPYRESALYHEYLLIGPGYAVDKISAITHDAKDVKVSEEEIQLIIYDEDGLHMWEVNPNIVQHNLAKEHVWALINATGMLPSMTVSNTTFQKTFRFHANEGDKISYHLSYPHIFRSTEPAPPIDVLVEFPANTRTLRTLKTMIDYQTFSLLRWRLSPAELVTDLTLSNLATRATTVTFQDDCDRYIVHEIHTASDNYFHPRYIKCIFQRRMKRIENPCIKDMFLVALILDYDRDYSLSTSQLLLAIPMVHDLGTKGFKGWMNMTDVYCPSGLDPEECGEPLDVVLTNDHLIILTDKGVWVSSSLDVTSANSSMHYKLKPLLKFTPIDPCSIFVDFNCTEIGTPVLGYNSIRRHRLFYTPVCHLYQYPHFEDIIIYVVDHVTQSPDLAEERDAYTVLYSTNKNRYRTWQILFKARYEYIASDGTFPIKELISIYFNHHRRLFDITVLLSGLDIERTIRFVLPQPTDADFLGYPELSGLLGKGFLEFEFPSNFGMTHHQVNTETMDGYFLGNQMWIAEAGGAFLYVSVPKVYDHNGNESRIEGCSFNHPDRSFVCAELTHAELYVGRVGVSYAPIAVDYRKITEFRYQSLYRYWPMPYLFHIGLTGHFVASYSGKIVLWFVPEYFILFQALMRVKKGIDAGDSCEATVANESPIRCLLCKKMAKLMSQHNCFIPDLAPSNTSQANNVGIKFPFSFEMIAFDPTKLKTRDTSTHGPLVPFPIDGDKVVVFEGEVAQLKGLVPERYYLNSINVGNKIICDTAPVELQPNETRCNEARQSHVDCELYIRHMKNLKRKGEFGFLEGFRTAFYATVGKSFPVWPIPCDLVIVILKDSNQAIIQLDKQMFDTSSQGEYRFDYSSIGMTLYIPQHFSILLNGFPKYESTGCSETGSTSFKHDFTRMVGYATRYYRLGARIHVKPFKAYLVKFPTQGFCARYLKSIDKPEFKDCQIVRGDETAVKYNQRIEEMQWKWRTMYNLHIDITQAVNSNMREDIETYGNMAGVVGDFFEHASDVEWSSYRQMEEDLLSLPEGPSVGQLETTRLQINKTNVPTHLTDLSTFKCDENRWSIIDGGCHLQLILDRNLVILQNGGRISLDKHDSISFTMKLRALTPLGRSLIHRPLMIVTNSNPDVLVVERQETIGRDPQILKITLTPTGIKKGVASVTVRPIIVSTYCPFSDGSFTLIVQVQREQGRRLHINYPIPTCKPRPSDFDFVRPWKVDLPNCVKRKELTKDVIRLGEIFYSQLPVNYRPPSYVGTDVPITRNVYNVDPTKPKFRNWYRISQESDELKKCSGKKRRKECECTDNDALSDDEIFSDCKKMVYTVKRGMRVDISVEYDRIMRDQDQHVEFFSPKRNWSVYVMEVNNRTEYTASSQQTLYVQTVHENKDLRQDINRQYYDSQSLSITPHGTGLFHYKVTLGNFDTFDEVTGYFMLYVPDNDLNHVQMMSVMLLTITICMTLVFVGFLIVRKRLVAQLPFQVQEKNRIKLD